jgi:DNA-binding NtrC family response regulator
VLVVDDEALIRWSICTALAGEGFDAVCAGDAADAQALAQQWPPPKVAVLDGFLSAEKEGSLMKAIRHIYPYCRFVIITTSPRETRGCPTHGRGVQVIHKPFDLAGVVRAVRDLAAS